MRKPEPWPTGQLLSRGILDFGDQESCTFDILGAMTWRPVGTSISKVGS
ncbi:hypothetical protein CLAFUW4_08496, partial [Fulvia fulva]